MNKLTIKQVKVTSSFWKQYRQILAEDAVPFQWDMINDKGKMDTVNSSAAGGAADHSGAIANLEIAAGRKKGHHFGMPFQDTDVYKWLETAAYVLRYDANPELKKEANWTVDLIADAQDPDGYLSTYFQIDAPERKFKQLQQSHELYTMGHGIEGLVAIYQTLNNKKALDVAKKMADCINNHFGPEENKIHGYDGHPEIELALCKLYEVTQDKKYLDLAKYFVEQRGQDIHFFDKQNEKIDPKYDFFAGMRNWSNRYYFADKPILDQKDAHGHAVRVLYFCTGLAHVARAENDAQLLHAAETMWTDIVRRQMYVTGSVGQTTNGEAFTYDYDLPNDTDYGETCAAVSLAFFAKQMMDHHFTGEIGDVIEKELFNGALSGISLDGKHYFYANPLEADPKASKYNPGKGHISLRRSSWFACACCPANITRLLASLDQYLYAVKDNTILSYQFIANDTKFSNGIEIKQDDEFPWQGNVKYSISNPNKQEFTLGIRIPNWSVKHYILEVNGEVVRPEAKENIVYLKISDDTDIELKLDMDVHLVRANTKVKDDIMKVAIQRGPIVYCAESCDNTEPLWDYILTKKPKFNYEYHADLLKGVVILTTNDVYRISTNNDQLYTFDEEPVKEKSKLTLIPYYAWANREEKQMQVWFNHESI